VALWGEGGDAEGANGRGQDGGHQGAHLRRARRGGRVRPLRLLLQVAPSASPEPR
jgi:hypothetical protein